jgi:predicted nucleic acid-binding protein
LERHLGSEPLLATSCIAVVEVSRATSLANPAPEVKEAAEALLAACMLVDLKDALLRAAAALASTSVRTLDAIHLASALKLEPVEFVAYDRRLAAAAVEHGLSVASPGAGSRS